MRLISQQASCCYCVQLTSSSVIKSTIAIDSYGLVLFGLYRLIVTHFPNPETRTVFCHLACQPTNKMQNYNWKLTTHAYSFQRFMFNFKVDWCRKINLIFIMYTVTNTCWELVYYLFVELIINVYFEASNTCICMTRSLAGFDITSLSHPFIFFHVCVGDINKTF